MTFSCSVLTAVDFIEVGTSNFDTLLQAATLSASPQDIAGLSVEALPHYLARLPDSSKTLTKVNAAIVPEDFKNGTSQNMFFIHPRDITRLKLPSWLMGCNRMGAPHPEAVKALSGRKLSMHLIRNVSVPLLSFRSLLDRYCIASVGFLKLE